MTTPCRLFVIMARKAPVAAVIRRGPSKWTQIIEWNTRRDTFTNGAWFKGRIYAEKSDVSPDGTLFAYFCHKGVKFDSDYTDSWTAVSRLPWLHALALWPSGTTYGGGGRFRSEREIELRTGLEPRHHPDHRPRGLKVVTGGAHLHVSTEEVEDADWAGRDLSGRLVFAKAGKLFARTEDGDEELADFNDRTPDPQDAPDWAKTPLV